LDSEVMIQNVTCKACILTEFFYDFTHSHQANAGILSCATFGVVGVMSVYFMSFHQLHCY